MRRVRWRRVGMGTKFLNPITDGTVLPVLHLNGSVGPLFHMDRITRRR